MGTGASTSLSLKRLNSAVQTSARRHPSFRFVRAAQRSAFKLPLIRVPIFEAAYKYFDK